MSKPAATRSPSPMWGVTPDPAPATVAGTPHLASPPGAGQISAAKASAPKGAPVPPPALPADPPVTAGRLPSLKAGRPVHLELVACRLSISRRGSLARNLAGSYACRDGIGAQRLRVLSLHHAFSELAGLLAARARRWGAAADRCRMRRCRLGIPRDACAGIRCQHLLQRRIGARRGHRRQVCMRA